MPSSTFLKEKAMISMTAYVTTGKPGTHVWSKMAEMDWMAMRIPENYGGVGMDQLDLNLIPVEAVKSIAIKQFSIAMLLTA